jgi:hypothetical protein
MAAKYSELQKRIVEAELARLQRPLTSLYEGPGAHSTLLSPMPLFNEAIMDMDLQI